MGIATDVRSPYFRFALDMIQMAGSTTAVVLLFYTGLSTWSVAATVITSAFTILSLLLFRTTDLRRRARDVMKPK